VPPDYIWGDALAAVDAAAADLRIINLETSITADGTPEPKGINYRMHPDNTPAIAAFKPDACVLANNHIADWGPESVTDTLDALAAVDIAHVGAGRNAEEAARPLSLEADDARLRLFAVACPSSGTPEHWSAGPDAPGVNFLPDASTTSFERLAQHIAAHGAPEDIVMLSIHWGGNWGYEIPERHGDFAHALIEHAGVDIIFGHSSHHPKAIEVHRGRPILYGCGDFLNDYEGIRGHESYRPDLVLGYILDLDAHGTLTRLEVLPFRLRKFRLNNASAEEAEWLRARLDRECRKFGRGVSLADGRLVLET
jgi:poly-gamma-glutamate synthesis protein (capsule biosynthesis protein)